MKRVVVLLLLITWTVWVLPKTACARETVRMATLEWPPYAGENLPGQGASIMVAKEAFAAVGIELKVSFYPWKRAVDHGLNMNGFIGYLPEYDADRLDMVCHLSERMGDSPLGVVERVDEPLEWEKVEDLGVYTLGVVDGYVNTPRFDTLMNLGVLDVEKVTDDATNIRKVQGGRIDGAVMDRNVFFYLADTEDTIRRERYLVRFGPRLLADNGLYACFRKTPDGKRLRDAFNRGLSRIDYRAIQDKYIENALGDWRY